jgi:hypothetical protein
MRQNRRFKPGCHVNQFPRPRCHAAGQNGIMIPRESCDGHTFCRCIEKKRQHMGGLVVIMMMLKCQHVTNFLGKIIVTRLFVMRAVHGTEMIA